MATTIEIDLLRPVVIGEETVEARRSHVKHPNTTRPAAQYFDRNIFSGSIVSNRAKLSVVESASPRVVARKDTSGEKYSLEPHTGNLFEALSKDIRSVAVADEVEFRLRVTGQIIAVPILKQVVVSLAGPWYGAPNFRQVTIGCFYDFRGWCPVTNVRANPFDPPTVSGANPVEDENDGTP